MGLSSVPPQCSRVLRSDNSRNHGLSAKPPIIPNSIQKRKGIKKQDTEPNSMAMVSFVCFWVATIVSKVQNRTCEVTY
jgi:hypothetical protein